MRGEAVLRNERDLDWKLRRRWLKPWGAEKTGIRIRSLLRVSGDEDEGAETAIHLLSGSSCRSLKLAYVHVVESLISGNADVEMTDKIDFVIDCLGKDESRS
jgi:hypothetical protein